MKYLSWLRSRVGRLPAILFAIITYFFLLDVGGLRFFPQGDVSASVLAAFWFRFGFSSLIALIFLAVGSLVWLFARDRRVALLLFCFSFSMMTTFAVEIGSIVAEGVSLSNIVSTISSLLTLAFFALFLTLFPRNYLSSKLSRENRHNHPVSYFLLLGYLIVMSFLCLVAIIVALPYYLRLPFSDILFHFSLDVYVLFVLVGIMITIIISYRGLPTLRERQQIRLFIGGVVLAIAPFLVLTIFPNVLHLPQKLAVDSQISTLTVIFLPLALGYSILRYQILVFDMYIRRFVSWVVGVVSLIVLGYLVVTFTSLTTWDSVTAHIVVVTVLLVILAPLIWWLAHVMTELLFFDEIRHFRHFIEKPALLAREILDIDEAARLLTLAMVHAFEIGEVCLFILDQESRYYQLSPELDNRSQQDLARHRLVQLLVSASRSEDEATRVPGYTAPFDEVNWLPEHLSLITNVGLFERPLLLSEAAREEGELPAGLARYLSTSVSVENDPLLIPVRTQGKMIGLLVLGRRIDGQQYAGPDFEAIALILERFAPVLETARLHERERRHVATLKALYSASATMKKAYQATEEVTTTYANAAAEAVKASAEIWLSDETDGSLRFVLHVGSGPHLPSYGNLTPLNESDWLSLFYDGENFSNWKESSVEAPSCLSQKPLFPFAWLPLSKGGQRFGVLILTYSRPHHFTHEERQELAMFADQCASEHAEVHASPPRAIKVIFCSAREDKKLRDKLEKHLGGLQRSGQIEIWFDRAIQPGMAWKREIEKHIDTADIILLLISPHFIHSDYCYKVEMPRALQRYQAGEACVIPIILRPVEWQTLPIIELQALPTDRKPITAWPKPDAAFVDVARGIGEVVRTLLAQFETAKEQPEEYKHTLKL